MIEILFVGSGGGHIAQLKQLEPWYEGKERVWVTEDTVSTRSFIGEDLMIPGHFPSTRNIPNMFRNFVLAVKVLRKLRPKVVISNGAAIAFPFFVAAKILQIPTIYIEVYDRVDTKTLTGRLVEHIATEFLVQWESQQKLYPKSKLIGSLY